MVQRNRTFKRLDSVLQAFPALPTRLNNFASLNNSTTPYSRKRENSSKYSFEHLGTGNVPYRGPSWGQLEDNVQRSGWKRADDNDNGYDYWPPKPASPQPSSPTANHAPTLGHRGSPDDDAATSSVREISVPPIGRQACRFNNNKVVWTKSACSISKLAPDLDLFQFVFRGVDLSVVEGSPLVIGDREEKLLDKSTHS